MKEISDKIFDTARESIIIIDDKYKIVNGNYAFYKKFGIIEKNIQGKSLLDIVEKKWGIDPFKNFLLNILSKKKEVEDYVIENIKGKNIIVNARWLEERKVFVLTMEQATDKL
jgi:PAS domain S-box-containing protein